MLEVKKDDSVKTILKIYNNDIERFKNNHAKYERRIVDADD